MKRLRRYPACCTLRESFVAFVLLVSLGACTAIPDSQKISSVHEREALARSTVVAVGTPKLDPAKPSTISWKIPVVVSGADNYAGVELIRGITHSAIQQQITDKGYPIISVGGDFQLSAVVIIDTSKTGADHEHSELFDKTGMDPGLKSASSADGKGSLVIELRQGLAVRWRGAVQIHILPQLSGADVARRINYAVSQLLATWPSH